MDYYQRLKKQLHAGNHIMFTSDEYDLDVWFDDSDTWHGGYKVWFNGKMIASYKTYTAFYNKVWDLREKYALTQVETSTCPYCGKEIVATDDGIDEAEHMQYCNPAFRSAELGERP